MSFPYRPEDAPPSPIRLDAEIPRPEIEVEITGPAGAATIRGLVDTGADATLLPRLLAELIGVDLEPVAGLTASGIEGPALDVAAGEVTWTLGAGPEAIRWRSRVAFVDHGNPDEATILLGFAGFLEFFVATFDGPGRRLDLVPGPNLPTDP